MTPLDHGHKGPLRGKAVGDQATIDNHTIVERHVDKWHEHGDGIHQGDIASDKRSPKHVSGAAPEKRTKRARRWRTKKTNALAKNTHKLNLAKLDESLHNLSVQNLSAPNLTQHNQSVQNIASETMISATLAHDETAFANLNVENNQQSDVNKKRRRKKRRGKQHISPNIVTNIENTGFCDTHLMQNNAAPIKSPQVKNLQVKKLEAKNRQIGNVLKKTAKQHKNLDPIIKHAHSIGHASAPLYAALDLGTNNCRLLIASPTKPGHFRVVDAFSRIVRLGEGLTSTGRLNEKAMDRAIEALKICANKLRHKNITHQRFIATEACRSAVNGNVFIQRVLAETGLKLEIVDRETEARLAVSGCGTLVEKNTTAIVLFDIGGGSSEIALIDMSKQRSPRLAEHITAWTSLPVGVVTLAEQFGGENVSATDFALMKNHVSSLLRNFAERHKLGELTKSPHFYLMGTSGTVTTLAGIHLDLERYDRRQIDGIWMNNKDVSKMTEKLLSMDMAERVANPCIGQDRADLVLAGCAILEAIRDVWPSERLRVADRGLREGILTELMSRDGAWRRKKIRLSQRLYGNRRKATKA